MKKTVYILMMFLFVLVSYISFQAGVCLEHSGEAKSIVLDIPIKKLLARPDENAKVVYEIPIEVRLLTCTPDKKWYKTRISYDFLGHYQYDGWCKVER